MNPLRLFVVSGLLLPSFANAVSPGNGYVEGNGGQSVYCREDSRHGPPGWYFLDFLFATYQIDLDLGPVRNSSDARQSLTAIVNRLRDTKPVLAGDLQSFWSEFDSKKNWVPGYLRRNIASAGQIPWNSPVAIPSSCLRIGHHSSTRVPYWYETVVQVLNKDQNERHYLFDWDILNALDLTDQLSWLIVHEWLWTVHPRVDPVAIRSLNYYLHSERFFSDSLEEVLDRLSP